MWILCTMHNWQKGKHSHIHIYMYLIEPKWLLKGLHITIVNECDLRYSAWSRYYIDTLYHQTIFSLFCPIRSAKRKEFYFRKSHFPVDCKSKTTFFFYLPEKELIEPRLSVFNENQSNIAVDSLIFGWRSSMAYY